jgi:hypothetical protein
LNNIKIIIKGENYGCFKFNFKRDCHKNGSIKITKFDVVILTNEEIAKFITILLNMKNTIVFNETFPSLQYDELKNSS